MILGLHAPNPQKVANTVRPRNTERISNETLYNITKHVAWEINRTSLQSIRIQVVQIRISLCPAYTAKRHPGNEVVHHENKAVNCFRWYEMRFWSTTHPKSRKCLHVQLHTTPLTGASRTNCMNRSSMNTRSCREYRNSTWLGSSLADSG